ncbi:MAG: DUF4393 domain-containing protein [Desulfarculus sp.]|nr:DUF4393 domain-containing protein [Desulfarculus sp.]
MSDLVPMDKLQIEACKAFGKEAANNVFAFLGDITGPPAKELGGLLADQVRFLRFKNQFKLIEKTRAFLKGKKPQEVPLRILAPLLEHASWAEEDILQDKWASLLASAAMPGADVSNHATYVELLRQLSPIHVAFLDFMYKSSNYSSRRFGRLPEYIADQDVMRELLIGEDQYAICCELLISLNLISQDIILNTDNLEIEKENGLFSATPKLKIKKRLWRELVSRDIGSISLTFLGISFVRKCRHPLAPENRKAILLLIRENLNEIIDQHPNRSAALTNMARELTPEMLVDDIYGAVETGYRKITGQYIAYRDEEHPLTQEQKKELIEFIADDLRYMYG